MPSRSTPDTRGHAALLASIAACLLAGPVGACTTPEDAPTPSGRALRGPPGNVPGPASGEGDRPQSSASPFGPGARAPSPAGEEDGGARPQSPARDLAAELRSAIGLPSECLVGANATGTIRIGVTATIQPGGDVSRVNVLGGGLTDEGRRCMEARVSGIRLRGPIGIRPETVTTTVEAVQTAAGRPRIETAVGAPPPALPRDAVPISMAGGVPIRARQGMPIEPREGVPIERREGRAIEATPGVAIMGATGVPIGQ